MIGPRAKLAGLVAIFAIPIVASVLAYRFMRPEATANYGELLLPPATITAHAFGRAEGGRFAFQDLGGKWILVASDSGDCPEACMGKLATLRQVRLALGRNASRVARVFVVDDLRAPSPGAQKDFAGTEIAITPAGMSLPPGAANDRAHIYLVDPHGNVMMRWPAKGDSKRILGDMQRLLKASQIG